MELPKGLHGASLGFTWSFLEAYMELPRIVSGGVPEVFAGLSRDLIRYFIRRSLTEDLRDFTKTVSKIEPRARASVCLVRPRRVTVWTASTWRTIGTRRGRAWRVSG
jgi:hypothetical protein